MRRSRLRSPTKLIQVTSSKRTGVVDGEVDGVVDGVVDGAAAGLAEVGVGAAIMAGLVQAGAVAGAAGIRVVAVGESGNMTKAPATLSAGVSSFEE